jgi:hypothetical protein
MSLTNQTDKNALKSFQPYAPTLVQWRHMRLIMALASCKGHRLTVFSFAVHMRISKARLLSICGGMRFAGWLTVKDNRITVTSAERERFMIESGQIRSHDWKDGQLPRKYKAITIPARVQDRKVKANVNA